MKDYLIVGQGIAGTLLALLLKSAGKQVQLIDNNAGTAASQVAAGMVNPVVLKRFVPVWQAKAQLQTARQLLALCEKTFAQTFWRDLPLWRVFANANEASTWQQKRQQAALAPYLQEIAALPAPIMAPDAAGLVAQTAVVSMSALCQAARAAWQADVIETVFVHQDLNLHADYVDYHGVQAKRVVFCEGFALRENPFFNDLPLMGNKGELLCLAAKCLPPLPDFYRQNMLKAGVFLLPQMDGNFLVGASYDREDKTPVASAEKQAFLLQQLQKIWQVPVTALVESVLERRAGIRPTVIDRRPLLGQHPRYRPLYVLNGLGTRGVMQGAAMAQLMADFLLYDSPLPSDVDIARFRV